jgi:GNAT superfamily N-acetyltransferase
MGWVTTGEVSEFITEAGSFLREERARNTILLTVAETARLNPRRFTASASPAVRSPLYGWWTPGPDGADAVRGTVGGAVRGAFLHTPLFPVLLSGIPAEAAAELAARTLAGRPITGVNGYAEAARAFSEAWAANTGGAVEVHLRSRLYRLAELTWPDPMPAGAPRVAEDGDAALLTDWFAAFSDEVNDMGARDHADAVRERLSYGGLTIWEAAGEPVSIAGLTRQVAGMVRVGPVYTPPRARGHGYASAVTAEVSRAALAAGADEVLLYTDLANPVSNSIYQRIGFRVVEDRVVLAFTER